MTIDESCWAFVWEVPHYGNFISAIDSKMVRKNRNGVLHRRDFPKREKHYLLFPRVLPFGDFACIPLSLLFEEEPLFESLFFEVALLPDLFLLSSFMVLDF